MKKNKLNPNSRFKRNGENYMRGWEVTMAKDSDTNTSSKKAEELSWGTLEELLLACAVHRHGSQSWDSVAIEIQKRSSSVPCPTPDDCRQKYGDLKRRFINARDGTNGCDESEMEKLALMIAELKRLRVQELRREVQQRDVSIVSLELKVKRLHEERERSLKENDKEVDLNKDRPVDEGEGERRTAEFTGKPISGMDSGDRENGSYNESNSTNPKGEVRGANVDESNVKTKPVEPVVIEQNPVRNEPTLTGPCSNGSSIGPLAEEGDGVLKQVEVTIPVNGKTFEEFMAKSNREGKEGAKQSSDVQSSAGLSKRKRGRRAKGVVVGSSSGEDAEGVEFSPATKKVAVKSEPLARILEIIRSHKLGSMFERRLPNQETGNYKELVRQHMDLQTIKSQHEKGVYRDCMEKFFRDLLLIFNNAITFFPKSTPESVAAVKLRAIVLKEMAKKIKKRRSKADRAKSNLNSHRGRGRGGVTMVACTNRRRERAKKINDDDEFVVKSERGRKMTRGGRGGRSAGGGRRSSTMTKSEETMEVDIKIKETTVNHECGANVLSSHDNLEAKLDDKKDTVMTRKQGAASLLKRMNRNKDEVDETSEKNDSEDGRGKRKETRGRKRNNDGRNGRVTKSGGQEQSGQARRGVGRPPRKQTETTATGNGKKETEDGGGETDGVAGRLRRRVGAGKRTRAGGGESEVTEGRSRKRSRR